MLGSIFKIGKLCSDTKVDSDEETKEDLSKCPYGGKCKIYLAARDHYKVSNEIWGHLTDFSHPYLKCRYGEKCFSHLRLLAGGHELKDIVHHTVFYHSRAATASERGSTIDKITWAGLCFFKEESRPVCNEDKILDDMLKEIKKNGYEHCLTTPKGNTLLDVAKFKMNLPCFKKRRAKLEHFLALLIYTGTEMQSDIRKEFRDDICANYKWTYVSLMIREAVKLLSEQPPKLLYHGLNGVIAKTGDQVCYDNFVSFSQSYDVAIDFAKGKPTAKTPKQIGMILILDTSELKSWGQANLLKSKGLVSQTWYFADMRKISKFPAEQEWLYFPHNIGCLINRWKLTEVENEGKIKHMTMKFNN